MSFLDRFKAQPRWKHTDPAIRAAAVPEIPDTDEYRPVLVDLASTDEDVRVRRAALERIADVEVLVGRAHAEPDPELQREIADRLVARATAPAPDDAAAALALGGIRDEKPCATVAKQSPHDTVRTAALARVHDVKLLGSVARSAADPQTALEAARRIADPAELLNVALKTEHKDAGVSALERAVEAAGADPAAAPGVNDMLEQAATRARGKAVARRARAMLQAIEEAETARRRAREEWQQRIAGILARVEALAASPSAPNATGQLAQAEEQWRQAAGEGTFEMDAETTARFGGLMDMAREAIQAHERAEAERRAREEWLAARRTARTALCERVEALRGDDVPAQIDAARVEWVGLIDSPDGELDDEAAAFTRRFEDACQRAAARHENRQALGRTHARLAELSFDAERLTTGDEPAAEAWGALVREWQELHPRSEELDASVLERFQAAEARVRHRDEERRAASERTLRQQVQRAEQLVERAAARAAAEDLTLREADRIARDIRSTVDAPPDLPDREQRALIERLQTALAAISPRLHELREMDEWKRFANAAIQEDLIAKTEALRTKYGFDSEEGPAPESLEKAAAELHDIQERWKQAAEAPRAQAQALWHRYRQAADPIQARLRDFFAQRSAERQANLDRKLAIIARAEAICESSDWVRTAEEMKTLQAEWQAIGPVPRHETRATWKRFREACDRFFSRRNADLAERKQTWAANMAAKEALIARAEALALSTDWEAGAAEIRRLQADWKNTGPVRRNKSEAVWQRFRAACDTFFDRYKRRDQIALEAKQADREALVVEMESLGAPAPEPAGGATPPEGAGEALAAQPEPLEAAALLERVRSLRSRWNQTSPAVRHGADPLSARFMAALERLIAAHPEAFQNTELDVEASRRKMEKLCERVEGFLKESAPPASSSQALADMLREALASNTIGGRGGEESKWRAMAEDVRQAQASWNRLGPVPGDAGQQLAARFHKACSRFFDQYRRRVPQHEPQGPGPRRDRPRRDKPVGAR